MRDKNINSIQSVLIASFLATVVAGCSAAVEDERGTRMGVSGTVLIDETPIENARILFTPAGGDGSIKAVGLIINGSYKILPQFGPLAGKMRVEIQSELMEVEELESIRQGNMKMKVDLELVKIPLKFNKKSILTAVVSDDPQKNVFDFDLKSE